MATGESRQSGWPTDMEAEKTGATNKEPAKDTSPHRSFHSDICVPSANTQ